MSPSLKCFINGLLSLLIILAVILYFWNSLFQPNLHADFKIYRSALEIFWRNENPYDLLVWNRYWNSTSVAMVWNPPLIFVVLAPILLFSITYSLILCPYLALAIGIVVWRSQTNANIKILYLLSVSFGTLSFLSALLLGQIIVLLTLFLAVAFYSFKHNKDLIGGIFLGLLLIKPHAFYLCLFLLGVIFFKSKRYLAIAGALIGILVPSLIAEFFNRGIHASWFYRTEWPHNYYGATLTSLIMKSSIFESIELQKFIPVFLPLISVLMVIIHSKFLSRDLVAYLPIALILSPITAPYGYIFDQFPAIIVIVGLLSISIEIEIYRILLIQLSTLLLGMLFWQYGVTIYELPVYWFITPLSFLMIWYYSPVKEQLKLI